MVAQDIEHTVKATASKVRDVECAVCQGCFPRVQTNLVKQSKKGLSKYRGDTFKTTTDILAIVSKGSHKVAAKVERETAKATEAVTPKPPRRDLVVDKNLAKAALKQHDVVINRGGSRVEERDRKVHENVVDTGLSADRRDGCGRDGGFVRVVTRFTRSTSLVKQKTIQKTSTYSKRSRLKSEKNWWRNKLEHVEMTSCDHHHHLHPAFSPSSFLPSFFPSPHPRNSTITNTRSQSYSHSQQHTQTSRSIVPLDHGAHGTAQNTENHQKSGKLGVFMDPSPLFFFREVSHTSMNKGACAYTCVSALTLYGR